jgi:hypothetical protein
MSRIRSLGFESVRWFEWAADCFRCGTFGASFEGRVREGGVTGPAGEKIQYPLSFVPPSGSTCSLGCFFEGLFLRGVWCFLKALRPKAFLVRLAPWWSGKTNDNEIERWSRCKHVNFLRVRLHRLCFAPADFTLWDYSTRIRFNIGLEGFNMQTCWSLGGFEGTPSAGLKTLGRQSTDCGR